MTDAPLLRPDEPELLEELFGSFPGYMASPQRLEQLLAISIKRVHFEGVNELSDDAWWDYRPLSIGHSFMLFVVARLRALKTIGLHKGLIKSKGFKPGLMVQEIAKQSGALVWEHDNKEIAALWKAKTAADNFCIPYGKFAELSLVTALQDGWMRLPAVNQWYNERRMIRVIDTWEANLRLSFPLAKHPIYMAENYQEHPFQDGYQEWLMDRVANMASVSRGIANVMCFTTQLLEDKAVSRFGTDEVERAKSLYDREKR